VCVIILCLLHTCMLNVSSELRHILVPGCVGIMGGRPSSSFFFVKVRFGSLLLPMYSKRTLLVFRVIITLLQLLCTASGAPEHLLYETLFYFIFFSFIVFLFLFLFFSHMYSSCYVLLFTLSHSSFLFPMAKGTWTPTLRSQALFKAERLPKPRDSQVMSCYCPKRALFFDPSPQFCS
jgi:hypothetical protein